MDFIKQFLKKYDCYDEQLENYDEGTINEIVKIFNGNIKESYESSILLNYVGLYYRHQNKYELAEKYYLMVIEKEKNQSSQICMSKCAR